MTVRLHTAMDFIWVLSLGYQNKASQKVKDVTHSLHVKMQECVTGLRHYDFFLLHISRKNKHIIGVMARRGTNQPHFQWRIQQRFLGGGGTGNADKIVTFEQINQNTTYFSSSILHKKLLGEINATHVEITQLFHSGKEFNSCF